MQKEGWRALAAGFKGWVFEVSLRGWVLVVGFRGFRGGGGRVLAVPHWMGVQPLQLSFTVRGGGL